MWRKVQNAIRSVFDETTIQNLLEVDESGGVHCCK
jgi:hypothetical protein